MNKTIIIRAKNNNNSTKINNNIINDINLSLSAKSLLIIMLSNKDDEIIYKNDLCSKYKINSHKFSKLLKELKAYDYIKINNIKDKDGKRFVGCEYVLYENPDNLS